MTEKKENQPKLKYHCACAIGDLSAVQPGTAPSTNEKKRQTDGSETAPTSASGAAPRAVGQEETTVSKE